MLWVITTKQLTARKQLSLNFCGAKTNKPQPKPGFVVSLQPAMPDWVTGLGLL